MWLIGVITGAFIAAGIYPNSWPVGALVGGLIMARLADQSELRLVRLRADLEVQIQRLENEVMQLRARLKNFTEAAAPLSAFNSTPTPTANPTLTEVSTEEATTETVEPITLASSAAIAASLNLSNATQKIKLERTPATPEQQTAFESTTPPQTSLKTPTWLTRFWSANPLAKVGMVLLFLGLASALKLAVELGWLPVPVRLFLVAALGVGFIVWGASPTQQRQRPVFSWAVQGGGFALLYLVVYFMLDQYPVLSAAPAFALFAVLGVVCLLMAARQNAVSLAVLGLAGAFLAPLLSGGNADSPLLLFSYFTLLNFLIVLVSWFKSWRALNLTGFIFTLVIGLSWASSRYETQHYALVQFFLLVFVALYSLMPVLSVLFRTAGRFAWQDATLWFGTPLAGAYLQVSLVKHWPNAAAVSLLIGAAWYVLLWALLYFRSPLAESRSAELTAEPTPGALSPRLLERSYLAVAVALLTTAVPLAFGAQLTSAVWALEGSALLWFGVHTQRRVAQTFGLLMQGAAGAVLLIHYQYVTPTTPVFNNFVLGGAMLVTSALLSTHWLRTQALSTLPARTFLPAALPFSWAVLWWLGVGWQEINHGATGTWRAALHLLWVMGAVLAVEGLSRYWRWPSWRRFSLLLLAALCLTPLMPWFSYGHPLAGAMLWAWPLALLVHYVLLAQHEKHQKARQQAEQTDGVNTFTTASYARIRHVGAYWAALFFTAAELAFYAPNALWNFVAWAGVFTLGIALALQGQVHRWWPFKQSVYLQVGVLPLAFALLMLLAGACLEQSGSGSGLSYLPLLSVFDLTQLAALAVLFQLSQHWTASKPELSKLCRLAISVVGFIALSTLAGRVVHAWFGVAFDWSELFSALEFQAALSLVWTSGALATMLLAARRAQRNLWFGGFAWLMVVGVKLLLLDTAGRGTITWTLTLLGVALLVLAASYFAPLPPAAEQKEK